MTRRELRKRYEDFGRRGAPIAAAYATFILLAIVGSLVMLATGPRSGTHHLVAAGVVIFVVVPLSLAVMSRITRRRATARGLVCPHCGKLLIGEPARIVIAAGHCCFCGEAIVSDA